MTLWPKTITGWSEGRTGYLSVPFTWLLPEARRIVTQRHLWVDHWIVGGPAVRLMPDYLADTPAVVTLDDRPGVLQRVNPQATRTTTGCPRRCRFCGVDRIEPKWRELDDWPNLPVICDNNLTAANYDHFARVIGRLQAHDGPDFSQGLDHRFITPERAALLATLRKPIIRLALDWAALAELDSWALAVDRLLTAGLAKRRIRSYVLCGFAGSPALDRERCEFVESFGVLALPMWFHELDAMEFNAVTPKQQAMGWTDRQRRALFAWYYQHRTLEVRG